MYFLRRTLLPFIIIIFVPTYIFAKNFECKTINYSNATYKGQYHNNKFHGYGIIEWKETNERYLGTWNMGKRYGYGIYYWEPNQYYYGEWLNDNPEGHGIYISNDTIIEGEWKNNSIQKRFNINKSVLIKSLDAVLKSIEYC